MVCSDEKVLSDNIVACSSYLPCDILLLTDSDASVQLAPTNITEVCARQLVETGDEARNKCTEICYPSDFCKENETNDCCFSKDINTTIACLSYTPCEILSLTDPKNDVVLAPTNLTFTCSRANIEYIEEDKADCERLCAPASCCKDSRIGKMVLWIMLHNVFLMSRAKF